MLKVTTTGIWQWSRMPLQYRTSPHPAQCSTLSVPVGTDVSFVPYKHTLRVFKKKLVQMHLRNGIRWEGEAHIRE